MSYKKISSITFGLGSIAVLVLALFTFTPIERANLPFADEPELNSLTGMPGNDGPVLVVKIDDTVFSHPQVGLSSADVVYIEQVEGGLTRLAAVFSSDLPSIIGPVRSARISDIELLSQYGKVGFAFSGAQRKLLPEIASANLFDLGAMKYGPQFYANDETRNAPYAMMLNAPLLLIEAQSRGATPDVAKSMGWKFGDAPQNMKPVAKVHIAWPAASYDATWSDDQDRWLLSHNGRANLDSDGYQLGSPTLVIQLVSITDSIYRDKLGGTTPFSATVGDGDCYLLRDGGYLPCRWNRPDSASGTTFTDSLGDEINFAPGQIWFALTDKKPVFTEILGQDATSGTSK